jgi:molybdenum cofactor biosynthesis enzyme MoaA
VAHGVRKLRLTGGEPLLRKNLEAADRQLADAAHARRPGRWTSR